MPENEIGNSRGDTEAQSLPVKTSASPRLCEKIKTKDSGIPWIGEIPADWEVIPFKRIFRESKSVSEFGEEMLLSVSQYTGITPKKDSVSDGEHLSRAESLAGYRIVHVDDFVMNIMLAWNGSLGISQYSGIVSPAYAVFRLIRKSHPQFLHYLLRTEAYTTYFRAFSSGIIESRLRLYPEIFLRLLCVLPPVGTQKRIAEFLDKKCAEIDALIALQEKMITELKSYKQSVITEAVTRGIPAANIKTSHGDTETRSVPLKDSGIPWLGSIPAHWEVRPLKTCATINDDVLSENTPEDFVIKYIDIGSVSLTNGISRFEEMIFSESPSRARRKVKNGDVIISTVRTYLRAIAEVKNPEENWICSTGFAVVRAGEKLHSGFMKYALTSEYFVGDVIRYSSGLNYPTINTPELGSIKIFVPPQNEQRTISKYLDQKCAEIDSLISLKQQKITTFQNYKKSVIFEYVTGKKKA